MTKSKTQDLSITPARIDAAAKPVLAQFNTLPGLPKKVESEKDYIQVGAWIQVDKDLLKQLDQQKEDIITPIHRALTKLREHQNAIREPIKAHLAKSRALMTDWQRKLRAIETKKAERKAQRLEKKGDEEQAQAVREVAKTIPIVARVAATRTVTRWVFKITDEKAIPIQQGDFLLRPVDEKILRKLSKLGEMAPKIPGVEFFQETKVE